jgi:signal transduction histidine kinase
VFGAARAHALFAGIPAVPPAHFIDRLERELAGSIGAASAHVMLSKVVSGDPVSLEEVMQMADETQQAIEYSQRLERTSAELRSTAEQLEQANTRLRAVDQQKDEFLSQVSHEVRTPMTAIRSFSEILLDDEGLGAEERERFISTIHTESLRLTGLLDEILDLSALERGERGWEDRPIDAEAALERALAVCNALARQRGVAVQIAERAPPTLVSGEANRLSQVLINLISNAIKYGRVEDGRVEIRSRRVDAEYIVEVSDNGPGIAPDEGAKIFEKFYRGRGTGQSGEAGAGLGLAISREIIARMCGRLELVPHAGRGALFRMALPVVAEPGAAAAEGQRERVRMK